MSTSICKANVFAIICTLLALAATPPTRAADGPYIGDFNLALEILPPPPVEGSAEQAGDLAEATFVHDGANDTDRAAACSEKKFSIDLFAPSIGSSFNLDALPKTKKLLREVLEETQKITQAAKTNWHRPRPYQIDRRLLGCDEAEPFTSYPSGHSTRGTVFALVLSDLFPESREKILAEGRLIGWHRIMIGAHFPIDVYAGRVLGQAIMRELKSNPTFRADLEKAEHEVAEFEKRSSP
jgi:acid phosphatase (class A)